MRLHLELRRTREAKESGSVSRKMLLHCQNRLEDSTRGDRGLTAAQSHLGGPRGSKGRVV